MSGCLKPTVYIPIGSQAVVTFDRTPRVQSGELLSGTPTVVDDNSTGELSLSNKQVNTVADTENEIAIGKAVQFMISTTSTTCKEYEIATEVETNGTPVQTLADKMIVVFHD